MGVHGHAMANERARELRKSRTGAERRLWWKLRGLKPAGFKFRQQVPIDRYIVDFACLSSRVIIEVDGGTHSTDAELAKDKRREQYLRDQGFRILRVWNSEVRENIDGVMDTIVDALGSPPSSRPPKAEARPWRGGRVRRLQPKQGAEGGTLGPPPPSPPRKGEGRRPRRGREPRHEAEQNAEVDALGPPPPSPPRKGEGRRLRRGRVHLRDPMLAVARQAAAAVVDPEIPVLTIEDLGVLRGVERRDGRIVVKIAPTYTGCPATLTIRETLEAALLQAGMVGASVEMELSPPWSSDDITEEGRRKLEAYGIAPPNRAGGVRVLFGAEVVACPRCGSTDTVRISEFGSTACKALWRCATCAEPFDYFKCI